MDFSDVSYGDDRNQDAICLNTDNPMGYVPPPWTEYYPLSVVARNCLMWHRTCLAT
ncbi:MAG: hypothetical protein ACLU18_00395 [Bacteroides thetaiotaomicron]